MNLLKTYKEKNVVKLAGLFALNSDKRYGTIIKGIVPGLDVGILRPVYGSFVTNRGII